MRQSYAAMYPNLFRRNRAVFVFAALVASASALAQNWQPLFNGRDLSGWDTHLAKPQPTSTVSGLTRDAQGKYLELIGLNRDPLGIFTVTEIDFGFSMRSRRCCSQSGRFMPSGVSNSGAYAAR